MTVRVERDRLIVTITIDRPEALNAIDPETHQALVDAWIDFRDDPGLFVAILTGAGDRAFCSGADLKSYVPKYSAQSPRQWWQMTNGYGLGGITRNLEIYKPIIAAVNGYALAGGHELALACDFRIAAEHAVFGQGEVRWGTMSCDGATQRLPRIVGLGRAVDLVLTGKHISAAEALSMGLVSEVVPKDEVMTKARELADLLCSRSPASVMTCKRAILEGLNRPLREGLVFESTLAAPLSQHPDWQEGPRAFAEKRAPQFSRECRYPFEA
ncbi:MAG: enoyl-CoA hydratase/isomerase family protein [Chloroflexi bacterium]|nr:enoyl-CoA hydratase/isomerase family protein [Chloroflexota bacterium]